MIERRPNQSDCGRLARPAPRGLGGQLCDAAPVDPDGRQDPARSCADDQSLVAGAALRDQPRTDDLADFPMAHKSFQIDFDFIEHRLEIRTEPRRDRGFRAGPAKRRRFLRRGHGPAARPRARDEDLDHAGRDRGCHSLRPGQRSTPPTIRDYVNRFWRILVQVDRLFTRFRAQFIGKVSPVHFFWGSFDLAVTRFSGRTAPPLHEQFAQSRPLGDAGSLLARGKQLRLLAGQRRLRPAGVLSAMPIPSRRGSPRRR